MNNHDNTPPPRDKWTQVLEGLVYAIFPVGWALSYINNIYVTVPVLGRWSC